jgi:RNA polymerase sigma factor (sigma-70 family)
VIESAEASDAIAGTGPSEADDAALIRRSVDVPEVFAQLFDRHGEALHRYIARRLGADAADDLVSEAFLIAFTRRADYDGVYRDARPWLYGIATNLIGRRRRDEIRFLRALSRVGADVDTELSEDRVIDKVAAQAVRGRLLHALAGLPAAYRDTLLLVASGLSHDEVAAALNVPAGTIASRLARARGKLRSALGGANPVQARED